MDLRYYIKLEKDGWHDALTELPVGNTYLIDGERFSEEEEGREYLKRISLGSSISDTSRTIWAHIRRISPVSK